MFYNSTIHDVRPYLLNIGVSLATYSNPADTLIKLAIDPKLVNPKLNTQYLAKKCYEDFRKAERMMLMNRPGILKITQIGEDRSSNFGL